MAQKFGLSQVKKETPTWVLPALVAATFVCQGLPPIISGYEILKPQTKELISLFCDVANLLAAAVSLFFGKTATQKESE